MSRPLLCQFEKDCKQSPQSIHITTNKLTCEYHRTNSRESEQDFIPLISSDSLDDKFKETESAIKVLEEMLNKVDFGDLTNTIKRSIEQFKKKLKKAADNYFDVLLHKKYAKLISIKSDLDQIKTLMTNKGFWSTLTDEFFWYQIHSPHPQNPNEESKAPPFIPESQEPSTTSSRASTFSREEEGPNRQILSPRNNEIPAAMSLTTISQADSHNEETKEETKNEDNEPPLPEMDRPNTQIFGEQRIRNTTITTNQNRNRAGTEMRKNLTAVESSVYNTEDIVQLANESEEKSMIIKAFKIQEKLLNIKAPITHLEYDQIYEDTLIGSTSDFSRTKSLAFNFEDANDQAVIESIRSKVLPECKDLRLTNHTLKNKWFVSFIKTSFPVIVNNLTFNENSENLTLLDDYLSALTLVSKRVKDSIDVYNCLIKDASMKVFLSINCYKQKIGFFDCAIDIQNPSDFSYALECSQIKELYLNYCGNKRNSDWGTHPDRFIALVKGLSTAPDFVKSLEVIWIYDSGMEEREVREVLDRYGFQNVRILVHSP
ncbi:unnamed protein product [Moneuplotes crassus]|uniref:Uncharacterized protein n=1 Tax=Euplotes crassus TaxID=5936 RepID=A0AAD1U5W3_EUPCR|nr:unnamed protein product [Moneuplotes crassus]